ncbi:MAG: tetratricopeptide repeat protein [Candidatus Adiutrix sp.]|jgi:tetratricopeptide (TPR) repeat protein|nr:tetratricopeptide repeat protein [Candidatus Adiutrix sp.]
MALDLSPEPGDLAPPRRILGPSPLWLTYGVAAFLTLALALALWYGLAPESLARLCGRWLGQPLTIESLTLTLDRQTVDLAPGATLEMHPGQRLAIAGLKTSRWLNYDLHFHCSDPAMAALLTGAGVRPKDLWPAEALDQPQTVRLEVWDEGRTAAVFTLLIHYNALDFTVRGDAAATSREQIDSYQKALDLDPASDLVRDKLAAALAAAGQGALAAGLYEETLARLGPDETRLTSLLHIYDSLKQAPKQLEILSRLINLAESREQTTRPYWQRAAEIYQAAGQWPRAAEIYEALAQNAAQPEQAAVYLGHLVSLFHQSGAQAAEMAALNRLVELAPDNPDYQLELARALAEAGQNDRARAQYLEMASRWPEDQNIRLTLIALLEKTGDRKGLIQQYGQLAGLRPEDKIIAYNYGALLFEAKDWARAIEAFKKVLVIDPADQEAREYLLAAYQRRGQTRDMLELALELYRRDPSKTVYRDLMLNTYENAKDWANLARVAEIAVKLKPAEVKGWLSLGQARARLNKKDQAAQAYKKALSLEPKNKTAKEALAGLGAVKGQK